MDAPTTVKAYKSLSQVESAFRCYKSIDLKVRPIYHYKGERVKAHIFLCMLAYYVEWHLREALAPLLFEDGEYVFSRITQPTPLQQSCLDLLGVSLICPQ
jgi:transposase